MKAFSALLRWNVRLIAFVAGLALFASPGSAIEGQADDVATSSSAQLVDHGTCLGDDAPDRTPTVRSLLRNSLGSLRISTERTRVLSVSSASAGSIACSSANAQVRSTLFYAAHLTLVECGSLSSRTTSLPPPVSA